MLRGINNALLLALCASAIACGGATNQASDTGASGSGPKDTKAADPQEARPVPESQQASPDPEDEPQVTEKETRPGQPRKALSFFRAPDPGLRAKFTQGWDLGLDSLEEAQIDSEFLIDGPRVPPQVTDQEGLLILEGFLRCPETGLQDFRVEALGSLCLWVSGEIVAKSTNPANATPIRGSIALEKGWHALRLAWNKGPGETALKLTCGAAGAELSAPELDRWAH